MKCWEQSCQFSSTIRSWYNFDNIFEKISYGEVPEQIEIYFGGQSENVFIKCVTLGLNNGNKNFIDFPSSDFCSSIQNLKFLFTLKLETYTVITLIQTSLCTIFCWTNRMKKRK